jgi:hypothetical protein
VPVLLNYPKPLNISLIDLKGMKYQPYSMKMIQRESINLKKNLTGDQREVLL